jgi:Rrf2 family nitric oxide-sensitive transcriptional repressor
LRLTSFTDYSLRVLLYVATAPEGRATIGEIARAYSISEHHLVKVVHFLGVEGLLANSRGRGGGLQLAKPAKLIRIGEVVRLTEGEEAVVECFEDHRRCAISKVCRLSGLLARAMAAFHRVLDDVTLEDAIGDPAGLKAVLHGPIRVHG